MTNAIQRTTCLTLLQSLDIGAPVAEDDALLYDARVETSVFSDLVLDKVDIIRGTKGSGKSALYRLIADYHEHFLTDRRIAIIKAVETKGDPVFSLFMGDFDRFTEIEFENFWRIYFISIITSQFIGHPRYSHLLAPAKKELRTFLALAKKHGFPIKEKRFSLQSLMGWVVGTLGRIRRIETAVTPEAVPVVGVELAPAETVIPKVPMFVAELHEALIAVLEKVHLHLWIMIDRLDEAFPRRSDTERRALRALLRSTLAFKSELVRLKIFLRDDIFEAVTEDPSGFTALTHVKSRCSPVLSWKKDQILQLITNRIFSERSELTHFFTVDRRRLRRDERYRLSCFHKVFPEWLRPGAKQSSTLDWIYKHCEDGNGIVTPRDVIDLIRLAKHRQWEMLRADTNGDAECLLSPAAILQGHHDMSRDKKDNFLRAEYKHFWPVIARLENQRAEHDDASLRALLGPDYRFLPDLEAIGVLKRNARVGTVSIPFLYRPALSIRRGKSVGP